MASKTEGIIIDTNLWISFLIKKDYKGLDKYIFSKKIKLIFSPELLEEFISVSSRPKFHEFFTKEDIQSLLDLLDMHADLVDVKSQVEMCRDPKDNFLLSLAKDSKADYLLTGDSDLLEIENIGRTKICTLSEYLTNM